MSRGKQLLGVALLTTGMFAIGAQAQVQAPTTQPFTNYLAVKCPNTGQDPERLYGALIKNADTANEVALYEGVDYDPFDGTEYDDYEHSSGDLYRMRMITDDLHDSVDVYIIGVPASAARPLPIPKHVLREFIRNHRPRKPNVSPDSSPSRVSVYATGWTLDTSNLPSEIAAAQIQRIYLKRYKLKQGKDEVDSAPPGEGDVDDSERNPTPIGNGKNNLILRRKKVLAVGSEYSILKQTYFDQTPFLHSRKYWYVLEAVCKITPKVGTPFFVMLPSQPTKWSKD